MDAQVTKQEASGRYAWRNGTEEALRESEERFRSVVESATDAIVLADHRGNIISWNNAAQRLFGYTADEVAGKPLTILMPVRYREAHRRGVERLRSNGDSRVIGKTLALHGLKKDGTEFPLELSLGTWKTKEGTFYSGIIRDTTERKRAEEELQRLASFPELNPNPVIETDRGLTPTYQNPEAARLFPDLQAVGSQHPMLRGLSSVIDALEHGRLEKFVREVAVGAATYEQKVWYVPHGNRAVTYAVDITERKRDEERLAKVNECFLRFGETPNDNINRLTALCGELLGGTYALYSRLEWAMLRTVGRWRTPQDYPPAHKADGHFCHDVITRGGDHVIVVRHLPETPYAQTDPHVSAYKVRTYVGQAVRRCGAYIGALCVGCRQDFIPNEADRKLMGIIASAIGVEEERLQAQDRLIQAEKLASLGTLVSGMAHEINNPIQGVLGMAELILDEQAPDTIREYTQDIIEYSRHIAAVVHDFARYARSNAQEDAVDVDLCERLTEAVKMVRRSPHFGTVEVVTQFQPIPNLRARRVEIDQVFVNLLSNAVQAMEGRGQLGLATYSRGGTTIVRISDTGCGIPKALIHKIFDPFFTTKDPGNGTGLGLSIVYQIVNKYGGTIGIESEEGQGSTFTVQFPAES